MATRTFTLFHLSLIQPKQIDLEEIPRTREDWLRSALSEGFEFEYRSGNTMHWVPLDPVDECIFGLLERKRPHEHHLPPDRGGAEVVTDEWQGAYVLIDPTHHEDGQKAAVENDVVGKPGALLGKLIEAINYRHDKPYNIEFEPVFDSTSFWDFARSHDMILKNITFDFVVPNMWGTKSSLDEDLKDTGEQTGAERVAVSLKGSDGIYTDNQKVKDGVEYSERGAGNIKANALDGTPYSSKSKSKTTKIPEVKGDRKTMHEYFKNLKGRIFGREKDDSTTDHDNLGSHTADD